MRFCAQICFILIEVRIWTLSTWLQEEMTALAKIIAELQIQSCAWFWFYPYSKGLSHCNWGSHYYWAHGATLFKWVNVPYASTRSGENETYS